jgi:hypothetical protein
VTADAMMSTDFRPAQPAEKRFGVIRASPVWAASLLVIDALGQIAGVERVPMRRFVGVNG